MMCPGYQFSRIKGILFLASAFALIPMIATDAAGIQMDMIPSVRLEEGWDSNVSNTTTNEVSSFSTRLTPGLALVFTTPDQVVFKLSGQYQKIWYYNPEARNLENDNFFFRLDSTGAIKVKETLSMTPSAYYANTTNSSRRTQLVPSGDPLVPPVTITNYGNTKVEDFGGGVAFDYLATPNLSIGLSGNYGQQRFSDNTSESGLTDSKTVGGGASVSYLFTPLTSVGFRAAASHNTADNGSGSDTLFGGIVLGHQFSPVLHFTGTFGISQIRQGGDSGGTGERKYSPSGSFNLSYVSETSTASFFGSADYSGGSGYGVATFPWTVGISLTSRLTREWSGNLSGTYQKTKSVFASDSEVDLVSTTGTAGLIYQPWEWGSVNLTGGLNRQTSNGQFGDTLTNYSALLGVTIGKSYKIF
jgi:hypothetical protein